MFSEWVEQLTRDIILDTVSRLDITQDKKQKNAILLSPNKARKKTSLSESDQEPEREQED